MVVAPLSPPDTHAPPAATACCSGTQRPALPHAPAGSSTCSLLPPAAALLDGSYRPPSAHEQQQLERELLHQGRARAFPHVTGSFATHVYLTGGRNGLRPSLLPMPQVAALRRGVIRAHIEDAGYNQCRLNSCHHPLATVLCS
jgi:hypothetical protein